MEALFSNHYQFVPWSTIPCIVFAQSEITRPKTKDPFRNFYEAAETTMMLIRVRSNVGVWRVEVDDPVTAESVKMSLLNERPNLVFEKDLSLDPAGNQPLNGQSLSHGTMIYCRVDPSTCAAAATGDNTKRVIGKDGSIQTVVGSAKDNGFRHGLMALGDMKKSWTLAEFTALDAQFEFKIARQPESIAQQVSLDIPSITNFQRYCQTRRHRFAFLYGKFVEEEGEKPKILVEAIYEPPQEMDDSPEGFSMPEDPLEEKLEVLASSCGLQRVGWILSHPAREGYVLSGAETILAAELQLEAAGGVQETPFCMVTVSPKVDGTISVEAFQVSQQCLAMVAEEALVADPENPQKCKVHETFTAIQEGKASPTVETDFFVTPVPIAQHTSERWISDFPRHNRVDEHPSKSALKMSLQKANTQGWTLEDRLADFQLLLFLQQFLDASDMTKLCESIVEKKPLDDGYKLLIASLAGLDGAY